MLLEEVVVAILVLQIDVVEVSVEETIGLDILGV